MSLLSLPLSSNFPSSYSFTSPFSGNPSLILPSVKASKLPLQISKKSTSLHIVCLRGTLYTTNETATDQSQSIAPSLIIDRQSFPPGFTFGAASSACQIEGAWNEGGRGPCIWDNFCHEQPGKIADRSNADVAVDSYHRYKVKEDIKLLKDMNMDAYRFSISWSRILPTGSLKGGVNQDGIDYYNDLINELLANGITPYVTLFHWDVPQHLEDKYKGFLDKRIVDDFKGFCDVCFHEFGDRVKHWITLNEPWSFSSLGYGLGYHAPGRCTPAVFHCPVGDSAKDPYTVAHNLILAHGKAFRLYKDKYQATQGGQIGIALNSLWYVPYDQTYENVEAANRLMDFMLGCYMDPLVRGDYPFNMKALVRERLPAFSDEESKMIKNSFDFIGLNYYTAMYASCVPFKIESPVLSISDAWADQSPKKDGVDIGPCNGSWLYEYPRGIMDLLLHMKKRYGNPPVYITENGYSYVDKDDMPIEEALSDDIRRKYHAEHLAEVREAIAEGADVKGYFAWSLTDNFEWEHGFTERFGLAYVDYNTLERTPKDSAKWFSTILEK